MIRMPGMLWSREMIGIFESNLLHSHKNTEKMWKRMNQQRQPSFLDRCAITKAFISVRNPNKVYKWWRYSLFKKRIQNSKQKQWQKARRHTHRNIFLSCVWKKSEDLIQWILRLFCFGVVECIKKESALCFGSFVDLFLFFLAVSCLFNNAF